MPKNLTLQKTRRPKPSGQIAILFALVFTFMFVLFAFVVDFGNLVNAKINLQIAADAAAYSGAAWEARILNQIGQLNYRIRQDLKELALRAQVVHMRHNRNFPRGPQFWNAPGSAPQTEPFMCQQSTGYQAESGVKYAADTDLCRNASPTTGGLPPIVVPPIVAQFDAFAVAIASQIRAIQVKANQECRAAANDNSDLARHLSAVYAKRSQFHAQQIQVLEDYINQISGENPASSTHPAVASAYNSALKNLTLSNSTGNFSMKILQPTGGKLVQLEPHQMNASLFYINFQTRGDGCIGLPGYLDFNDMYAGFTKTQSIVTYFAVKLTASPRMLFMPQTWVDAAFPQLEAFAAAKPFGSRIGPDASADPLVPVPNRIGNNNRMINFSFKPGDQLGILNTKLLSYLDALLPRNSAGFPDGYQMTGWPEPDRPANRDALMAMRAPTIFDALLYTIFPDPNAPQDYDESQYVTALYPDYMEAADPNTDQVIDAGTPPTAAYFPSSVGSKNKGSGWVQINANNTGGGGGRDAYESYAYGEEQPASHSVRSVESLPLLPGREMEFGFATPPMISSAWTPQGHKGRIGYSVKFVGMDALVRTLRVKINDSGTTGPIANPPTGDPNITNIYH
jgi:hypothetical protein